MNKKSELNWFENGPLYFFIIVLIVAVILALIIKNVIINYVVIFLIGFLIGKSFYKRNYKRAMFLILVTVAFYIGFAIATPENSWKIMLITYILSGLISYESYKREIIK